MGGTSLSAAKGVAMRNHAHHCVLGVPPVSNPGYLSLASFLNTSIPRSITASAAA